MKFKDRLKQKRIDLDMTQEELADKTGLVGSAISHFETGQRTPSLNNLIRLCKGLECKPNDLVDV